MPDVLVDAEGGDVLEPGLVGSQLDEFGLNGPPPRLPRRAQLSGQARDRGVLAAQLPDRPRHRAHGDRPARGDQGRDLLHERPPHAVGIITTPHPLPPDQSHPRRAGHVVKNAAAATPTDSEHPARRATGRRRGARDRHHQQPVQTLDRLDMDAVETEQQIAAGARASGRARISAPRTMVRHVEVLGWSSSWRY